MDEKTTQQKIIRMLEGYNNKYKYIISMLMFDIVAEYGFNKSDLLDKIPELLSEEELNKKANESVSKKQILRPLINLSLEERNNMIEELKNYISSIEDNNGEIFVKEEVKIVYNEYKTKNDYLFLELPSEYVEIKDTTFDFEASIDGKIKIMEIAYKYDGPNSPLCIYNGGYKKADEIKDYYKNYIIDTYQASVVDYNGVTNIYTYESEVNDEQYFLEFVKYESSSEAPYLVILIQTCPRSLVNNYMKIIKRNANEGLYFYKPAEYLEAKCNNEITNSIKFEIKYQEFVLVDPEIKLDSKDKCEIVIDYDGDKEKNYIINNIKRYTDVIDTLISSKGTVLDSLYNSVLKQLADWEEDEGIDTDNISKYASINEIRLSKDSADDIKINIVAYIWDTDNDEELLGGHNLEASITVRNIINNTIRWSLE